MKKRIFLFLLFCTLIANAQTPVVIDLSTGKNDDGTLMSAPPPDVPNGGSVPDPDWSVLRPGETIQISTKTRHTYTGWSYPQLTLTGSSLQSRWITDKFGSFNMGDGNYYYFSKSFTIPQGTTDATLNLRALSFVRNWTYLVRTDVSPNTEELITRTQWINNSAIGWLNSRNPEVINKPLTPGTYQIKVRVYYRNTQVTNALNVYGLVTYTPQNCTTPAAPTFSTVTQPDCTTSTGSFTITNYDVNNTYTITPNTGVTQSGNTITVPAGTYIVTAASNGCTSSETSVMINSAPNCNWEKAPNSYIFDPSDNTKDGLYIPVKKAFSVWGSNEYLKDGGVSTPIPSGTDTAGLVWEDVPGLIKSVTLEGTGENAKLKVLVDKTKGKGNASVAYKVNDQIYWSWHIWVTDDPTQNGSTYSQSFETNINNEPTQIKYLDRNLGATSKEFLGNEWNKSGGLMYQWGRKDPIPTFVYKDFSFYEIYTENGTIRHKDTPTVPNSTKFIDNTARPYDEIGKNIRYSVQNPLTILHNTDSGTWFSKNQYRDSTIAWDLWSDNYRGGMSNASSSNTSLKMDSKSYEMKSSFDPCPNGWRVPSHYGRVTVNNNHSPFGRFNSGGNDDGSAWGEFSPTSKNDALPGVKVYPGLGYDFRENSNRNLGIISVSGNYEYYPNIVSPGSEPHLEFQDEASDGGLWEATYSQGGVRAFIYFSDPSRTDVGTHGLNKIYINQLPTSKDGNAVRCMKDPNLFSIGSTLSGTYGVTDFPTEFVSATEVPNYSEDELELPNSYMIANNTADPKTVNIPVKKAFAVNAKHFPENYAANFNSNVLSDLKTAVLWTDNQQLISQLSFDNSTVSRNSELVVDITPQQYGNAVVVLYNGNLSDPNVLWSWHIWATDEEVSTYTYTNDAVLPSTYHIINATPSKKPPLTTTFMDRNLGAVSAMPTALKDNPGDTALLNIAKESGGLQFQWGRKDPIPSFAKPGGEAYSIYKGTTEITPSSTSSLAYTTINGSNYLSNYTESYNNYSTSAGVLATDKKYVKTNKVMQYSVKRPLSFLYHSNVNATGIYDWISDENGLEPDRWGHADKKSVFDPCPSGWRVPDALAVLKEKGTSPWFNGKMSPGGVAGGSAQQSLQFIGSHYGGSAVNTSSGITYGWVFNNPNYNVGNFPNTRFRGSGPTNTVYTGTSTMGVWSSGASQRLSGTSVAMKIKKESDGHKVASGDQLSPQIAMNVRCVKDEPRYLGVTPPADSYNASGSSSNRMSQESSMITSKKSGEDLFIYPNPVIDVLKVTTSEPFDYVIYSIEGRKVSSGYTTKASIDVSNLVQGNYIININNKKDSVKSFKFIKK